MDITRILSIALGTILIENFVLARFLGVEDVLGRPQKTGSILGMGMAAVVVMVMTSAVSWVADTYLLKRLGLEYLRTVVFVLLIAALVQAVEMFLKRVLPTLHRAMGVYMPHLTANCAVLGVALMVTDGEIRYSFIEAVVFGFTAAIGFSLALLLFSGIQERLRFADIPASFEGFPIALVTAALLAMVFMGFSGLKVF